MAQKNSKLLPCGRKTFRHGEISATPRHVELQNRLKEFSTRQNLKYSEQRWKIAELILTTGGHLDAQAIVDRVKATYPEIGAATVYRNLKILCEASLLKESLTDSAGRVVYEVADDDAHHDHIVCSDCGEIFEFHDEKIEALQNQILSGMKFTQVRHRHVIYAKCNYLRSGDQAKSRDSVKAR